MTAGFVSVLWARYFRFLLYAALPPIFYALFAWESDGNTTSLSRWLELDSCRFRFDTFRCEALATFEP